jgi:cbb3-type cytochrome oxidase maturation protein
MDIVFLLVPLSLIFAFLIGAVFWFSLRSGQFDDLDGPAERVLMDDDRPAAGAPPQLRAASKQFDVDQ